MARDSITLSKEDDGTTDTLLYRREYAPPKWLARHSSTFWPWKNKEIEYSATSTNSSDDELSLDPRTPPNRSWRSQKTFRVAATVLSILCLAAYVLATAPMLLSAALAHRRFTCGSTLDEALARGCTFDPMTVQWLPPQCSRAGLDEFLVAHGTHTPYRKRSESSYPDQIANESTWRYYTDETQAVEYVDGLQAAPVGHYMYYTTRGEHLAHCTYILIRGAEARAAGERLDLLSGDLEHTRHCALFLFEYARQDPHFDTVNTPGDVMLGAC
ncbi:uncharacterized protein PAC_15405 [Phialocephala subalpina]|uniref:Uncharacterized protein n=1 Tax=Phialocephala subalpina TaxID=576137 RepID=A0A1L7XKB9_9HELO|nr:uncharacterized protein PAC_15405 [Phialocephala subalpina]